MAERVVRAEQRGMESGRTCMRTAQSKASTVRPVRAGDGVDIPLEAGCLEVHQVCEEGDEAPISRRPHALRPLESLLLPARMAQGPDQRSNEADLRMGRDLVTLAVRSLDRPRHGQDPGLVPTFEPCDCLGMVTEKYESATPCGRIEAELNVVPRTGVAHHFADLVTEPRLVSNARDRKSTRLNSSHRL